jgi:hypothetical protein
MTPQRKTDIIYVVEILLEHGWEACEELSETKADAVKAMRDYWKTRNPDDNFRVVRYKRMEDTDE